MTLTVILKNMPVLKKMQKLPLIKNFKPVKIQLHIVVVF